mgnify:CR=1 FL=1
MSSDSIILRGIELEIPTFLTGFICELRRDADSLITDGRRRANA